MDFENPIPKKNPAHPDKEPPSLKQEQGRPIAFPHGELATALFRKAFPEENVKTAIVKEVLDRFFEQEMNNASVFESTRLGASFPWTVIRTRELVKKLFATYGGTQPTDGDQGGESAPSLSGKKQEFIFGSYLRTVNGNFFTFVEEAMHRVMIALQSGLTDLEKGREPAQHEIYTLGSPTNELGDISQDFLERSKENPYDAFAGLYTEFIQSRIPADENHHSMTLYGISMGASLAAATGEKMVRGHIATQSPGEDLPSLHIRLDVPVALSTSKGRKWQIPIGVAADAIYQLITNPGTVKVALGERKFLDQVKAHLKERGIEDHISNQDIRMKNEVISALIGALRTGVEFDSSLKVTTVTGAYDPTTFSTSSIRAAREQKKKPESLGKPFVPRKNPNRREAVIDMPHFPPFFRPNELKRYHAVATLLEHLTPDTSRL